MTDCALYGKVETEADFVRVGVGRETEIAVQRWLKGAVEQSGGAVPKVTVRFVRRVEPQGPPCVGVWVPSRDAVGREFPLALFFSLPDEVDQLPLSCLPSGATRFADGVEPILHKLTGSSLEELQEACAQVTPVHASDLPHAWGKCIERAEGRSLREFAEVVFGPIEAEQMFYALHTLRSAAGARPMPSLMFPIADAEDAFVWLELLEAACPGACPDLFWTTGPRARLLASFSRQDSLFGPLWTTDDADSSIWPVTTRQPQAIDEARDHMTADERAQFEGTEPLAVSLPSLGGRR